ncbi:GM25931 [Drosophila sechellia]|uniref:SD04202p n=3 Tax=melanogaster subgroup TaxID=32351 RepID=Q9VFU6_DROME
MLTLWNQDILYGFGFASTMHSKYASSPSLMSSGFSEEPILSVVVGWSVDTWEKRFFCN